jgi:sugar O-acyltransferase (sialic acid O-acetyltransferase NeuD family)
MKKKNALLKKIVIIGAGGTGRGVIDIIESINQIQPQYEVLGYIIEPKYGAPGNMVYNRPILGSFDWLGEHSGEVEAICAIGPTDLKLKLVKRAEEMGVRFCNIISPLAYISPSISMGVGNIVGAFVVLGPDVHLQNHIFVNHSCAIGEDTEIEDYVTISPVTNIAGSSKISKGVFVSVGVTVIDRIKIGEWSMIGGGSSITRDVPPNTTVVGVPGRVVKERVKGWQLGVD